MQVDPDPAIPSATAERREREWQFIASDLAAAREWLANSGHRVQRLAPLEISDTYSDSPDWMIHRAGFGLRMRRLREVSPDSSSNSSNGESAVPDAAEITLKSLTPSVNGMADRRELTELVATLDPDSIANARGSVGQRVRELIGPRPLQPLFHGRTLRERYVLMPEFGDRPIAEIALDDTRITAPGTSGSEGERLVRVEVECLEGEHGSIEPGSIEPWVAELRTAAHLEPARKSKYEIGLALAGLEPPKAVELGRTSIDASMSVGEAQLAIYRRYFARMVECEPGTRLGENVEALHDMRVAVRRLDAAVRMFGDHAPRWAVRSHGALRTLTRSLGEARDLDVQRAFLDAFAGSLAPMHRKSLQPLRARIEQDRVRARARMLRVLDSQRVQRLWGVWVEHLRAEPRVDVPGDLPTVGQVASDLISGRHRKLRKRAEGLQKSSTAEEYHAVRSRSKRLRYAVDALGELYGDPAQRFAKAIGKLQDVLGNYQDAHVRAERVAAMASVHSAKFPAETLFVMGRLVERDALTASDSRAAFPKAYRRARGKRWKALRRVMRSMAARSVIRARTARVASDDTAEPQMSAAARRQSPGELHDRGPSSEQLALPARAVAAGRARRRVRTTAVSAGPEHDARAAGAQGSAPAGQGTRRHR
jgi:CHAD domain-containing protein